MQAFGREKRAEVKALWVGTPETLSKQDLFLKTVLAGTPAQYVVHENCHVAASQADCLMFVNYEFQIVPSYKNVFKNASLTLPTKPT
jgi:hypothetical protein